MAKASDQNGSDGKGRSPGARTGLDTRVVQGINAVRLVLGVPRGHPVPERSCLAHRLGSTVARLKLKGIGGGAQQREERAV